MVSHLKQLIEYLNDPIKVGVRLQRIEMDVSKLNDLKKALSLWKKRHKGAPDTELGPPAYTLYTTPKQVIEDLNKALRYYLFIKGTENEEPPR